MAHKILRRPAVEAGTGLSCSSIYRLIKEGTFPAPKRIGKRAVGWDSEEIQAWIDECLDHQPLNSDIVIKGVQLLSNLPNEDRLGVFDFVLGIDRNLAVAIADLTEIDAEQMKAAIAVAA